MSYKYMCKKIEKGEEKISVNILRFDVKKMKTLI